MLVVPFGAPRGARRGRRPGRRAARSPTSKLLAPLRALELGVPAELVALADGSPPSTARRSPARSALVLPPGAARRLSGRKRRAVAAPAPSRGRRAQPAPARADAPTSRRRSRRCARRSPRGALRAAPAARRHRLGQDRGLPARRGRRRSSRAAARSCSCPRSRSRRRSSARFIERFGDTVAVLHSRLRPAQRYAEWRRLREGEARVCVGPALGRVRPDRRPRPDRRRRGARRLLQARGRPALRRPRRRRRARRGARRAAAAGQRHAAAGERARLPASRLRSRVDGRPLPRVRGARHARGGRTACTRHRAGARRGPRARAARRSCCSTAAAGRTSSPAAPAGASGAARTATSRSCCTAPSGYLACHHCGHREPAPARCGTAPRASVARHGAGTERLQHDLASVFDDGDFPVFRLDADAVLRWRASRPPRPAPARSLRRLPGGRARRADRHADGRQGPRLPRRAASASCSTPTPPCASPTSAPRSARSR